MRVVLCLSLPAAQGGRAGGTFSRAEVWETPPPPPPPSAISLRDENEPVGQLATNPHTVLPGSEESQRPKIRMRSDSKVSLFVLAEITIPWKWLRRSFLFLETLESMNLTISNNSKELSRNGRRPFRGHCWPRDKQ